MRTVVTCGNLHSPTCLRLRQELALHCENQGPAMVGLQNLQERLLQFRPDLLAVVLPPDPESALAVIPQIRPLIAGPILTVGPVSDPKLILRALHAGADQWVDEDEMDVSLAAALQRVRSTEETVKETGKLTVVLPCSGGSGSSTVAVNLAVVLARARQKCALIDLNPGANDLAALLDLKPVHSLADLCAHKDRIDQAMLENCLVKHDSGVHLLAAPQQFRDIAAVKPQALAQSLTVIRAMFPETVVDLQDCYHEDQMVPLRQADRVLLVLRMDFTSLRNARRLIQHLESLNIPASRLELVANRTGQASELSVHPAEAALGRKLSHLIPDDPRVVNQCNNMGVPVMVEAPTSKVGRAMNGLSDAVVLAGAPSRESSRKATPLRVSLASRLQMFFS